VWAKFTNGMQVVSKLAVWLVESSTVEFYGVGYVGDGHAGSVKTGCLMVESSTVEFYGVG